MNLNESIKKAKEEGIVHFWDLPEGNRVVLDSKTKSELIKLLRKKYQSNAGVSRSAEIGRTTFNRYVIEGNYKLTIGILLKLCHTVDISESLLRELEKNIVWVGFANSQGIVNPKLPFNFKSREGARFLAAICNDGWISGGAYYSYNEQDLADSVKADALSVFGGDVNTVTMGYKGNDKYLVFPSIIRDVLVLVTGFKGVKSENNPPIPKFILKNKELICGWIEQTIADEGCVKFYPSTYRRELMWKRAFKKELNDYKLHEDEKAMLNKMGIEYDTYDNVGDYKTINGVNKITILVRIAKKENLLRLRSLIKIPSGRKDKKFSEALKDYEKPKEPLYVKDAITKSCRENLFVNGIELKNELKYKGLNAATKWLNFYQRQGLLKRLEDRGGKVPVDYVLNKT